MGLNLVYGAFPESRPAATQQTEQIIFESMPYMTAKEYGEFRGKKLNFFERLAYHSAQHQMAKPGKQSKGFNDWGCLLGWFLLPIGVLGAYIFSRDRNFRKWAWIGFGIGFLAFVVLAVISLHNLKI